MNILPRVASVLAVSIGLISSAGATTPVAQSSPAPVKNIVLVHGAWVDGSGWKPVYDILTRDGYHVSLVQEPLTSLEGDVAAAKRVLDLQNGPTILVGHSYGGSVITEAGVHPNVVGLVYVAAHAPNVGEDEAALGKGMPSYTSKQAGAIDKTADGYTYLNPGRLPEGLRGGPAAEASRIRVARSDPDGGGCLLNADDRCRLDHEAELGHRRGRRQDHQSGSGALVLRACA